MPLCSTTRTAHVEPIIVGARQVFVSVADRLLAVQEALCVVQRRLTRSDEVEPAALYE